MLHIVNSLGGNSKRYHRERARRARAIVSEVYSAPRVGKMAKRLPRYGLEPGIALDMTQHDDSGVKWDFRIKSHRDRAEQLLEQQKPLLLIGSPPCTPFSQWQHINRLKRDPAIVQRD